MAKFKAGDVAYIVESNNLVREVTIKRHSGGFYSEEHHEKRSSRTLQQRKQLTMTSHLVLNQQLRCIVQKNNSKEACYNAL